MSLDVALWAAIHRLHAIEALSNRTIALRLRCCHKTVAKALAMASPPAASPERQGSILDSYKPKIDALLTRYPDLSAVRIQEELARGEDGYRGELTLIRRYLKTKRPDRRRVYQEVLYEPGEAMQVDWGQAGWLSFGDTRRRVSVFVAVLCYSRLIFIAFTLSQKKAAFYRSIVEAVTFFGGVPRKLIHDNDKAATLHGSGRQAVHHPEFLALCGHYRMEPIACDVHDPESKGGVENGVRYVKGNALAGREDELTDVAAYGRLAVRWRDEVANVRCHAVTRERPIDRFQKERHVLRALPAVPFDADELVPAVVTPHARVCYDANRYSVPPAYARKPVFIRASSTTVAVLYQGQVMARHERDYAKGRLVVLPEHRLAALKLRKRSQSDLLEAEFRALGPEAVRFHEALRQTPGRPAVHIARLMKLAALYGKTELLGALAKAHEYATWDAAYVEAIVLAARRRRRLPSPVALCPKRTELIEEIHLDEPDPSGYDRLFGTEAQERP